MTVEKSFFLGLIAGEGTFTIRRHHSGDGAMYLNPYFQVRVKGCDSDTIEQMREEFDSVGEIYESVEGMVTWRVENKSDLEKLNNLITENSPEIWYETEKGKNYEIWSDVVEIYCDGQTTAKQRLKMAKMAKNSLNNNAENAKSESDWDEAIEVFKEQTKGNY